MGDGSQGRARRPRSMSSPLPLCVVAMMCSLLFFFRLRFLFQTAVRPTKNPLAEVAQEVASERYVAFAVR
jgi:hypothetical protein